ncbi:MAG: DUF6443 domain-containing protein [Chitinophagaceae bacterium]
MNIRNISKKIQQLFFTVLIGAPLQSIAQNYSGPINYVRTWDAVRPDTQSSSINTTALPKDFRMTTQYMDGLGRPVQTVMKHGSMHTGYPMTDMVETSVYDEFGREKFKYLPFQSSGGNPGQSDGLFKSNPAQQQVYSLGNTYVLSPLKGQNETHLYSQTNFEASPLNRVTETFAPGGSWAGTASQTTEAARKSVKVKYLTNTVLDSVRIWNVTNGGSVGAWGSYTTTSVYPAGQLTKTITIDEDGKQAIEFADKAGKIILKKVPVDTQTDAGTGAGHFRWICTYYIYDDLGNLRCVIQPIGVRILNLQTSPWVMTSAILSDQCFRYEYDERNRMIVKKVPGAAENYLVYDARDRVVLTQDGKLKATNKWLFTKYDALNRVIMSGMYTNSTYTTRSTMQAYLNTQAMGFSESMNSSGFAYTLNQSFPVITDSRDVYSITKYDNYDRTPMSFSFSGHFLGGQLYNTFNTAPLYAQPVVQSFATNGLVTWTQTKVLDTDNTYLSSVFIYDKDGRVIQQKQTNIWGQNNHTVVQYNWAGQVLCQMEETVTSSATLRTVTRMHYDDLGRLIRVEKKNAHSAINSLAYPTSFVTVFSQEYDALGRPAKKMIGNKKDPTTGTYYTSRQPLQELVTDYNVRGWTLGVNREYLISAGQTSDGKLFGYELGYDKQVTKAGRNFTATQYNGNITGMVWKSDGDDERRKYDYKYDASNRLKEALFEQKNPNNSNWDATVMNFSQYLGSAGHDGGAPMDENGNIWRMKTFGVTLASGNTMIDNLIYDYIPGTNKLRAVRDDGAAYNIGDFNDKNPLNATDYGYDVNGNMVTDLNKRINVNAASVGENITTGGGITYNHLNLPTQIVVRNDANNADKGTINYIYDAAGNKLKKVTLEYGVNVPYNGTTYNTNVTTITTYWNGAVYESKEYSHATVHSALAYFDRLQFIGHEEGRVRAVYNPAAPNNVAALEYDYMIKDHLGNVRMVLTEELKSNAYPAATMEESLATTEDQFYSNLTATRTTRPSAMPIDNTYSNPNERVAKVNSSTNKIGPAIMLKVMAGDRFNAHVDAWWTGSGAGLNTSPLSDIMSALITGAPSASGGKVAAGSLTTTLLTPQVTEFLNGQPATGSTKPKAYLNWMLFDEQFKLVGTNSSAAPVGDADEYLPITKSNMPIDKNGYLYIYVSNETNSDVFFDNLQVTHVRGSLLEESHYYPFGLTMAGISSKALQFGGPENKYKYNGIELGTELDLDIYEAFYRSLDPQTGRWWQIDPKTEKMEMWSPYASNYDNPIVYSDKLGDEGQSCCWFDFDAFMDGVRFVNRNLNPLTPIVELVTGKSQDSDFTEPKSRLETGREMLQSAMIPGKMGKPKPSTALNQTVSGALQVEQKVVNKLLEETKDAVKNTKQKGKITEPTLPDKTIVAKDGVEIVHYTKSGDHGPPHMHVKGGGKETKIGQNGKPVKGSPELTTQQSNVVDEFKAEIRSAAKKIMSWFNYNSK